MLKKLITTACILVLTANFSFGMNKKSNFKPNNQTLANSSANLGYLFAKTRLYYDFLAKVSSMSGKKNSHFKNPCDNCIIANNITSLAAFFIAYNIDDKLDSLIKKSDSNKKIKESLIKSATTLRELKSKDIPSLENRSNFTIPIEKSNNKLTFFQKIKSHLTLKNLYIGGSVSFFGYKIYKHITTKKKQ